MTGVAERMIVNAAGVGRPDAVIVEEPLEIIVVYHLVTVTQRAVHTVTMRTPGHDLELAAGIMMSDDVISSRNDFQGPFRYGDNEIRVALLPEVHYDPEQFRRTGYSSAACGLCGRLDIKRLTEVLDFNTSSITISMETIARLPTLAREQQSLFHRTGGCHAAASFDRDGQFLSLFEDVGRHNALDKLIGRAVLDEKALTNSVVFLSGRAGYEMVQKAAVARVPILVAVGAPTSLAIDLAEKVGMTLIGFVRDADFNIYSHPHRVTR